MDEDALLEQWIMQNIPEPEESLPDLWIVEQVQDGEILPDGTGYAGDWEEQPRVVDINGRRICECDDIEIARKIAREHNAAPDLLAACEKVPRLLKEIRGFACDAFGGESSLTDCIDLVLGEIEVAIAKARGKEEKDGRES